ncbi:MAG: aminopeptidase P family N-terminal domain-containing protein, partial [Candidatus Gastranaerophilales bacterium]|nr:aminopeptidase P family N-terminal domain-containing protein [Candidatus Gastranaerophilales bacterium]
MHNRNKQIKYYTDLLKENEILLLKSQDAYFKNHYSSSPLALLTGFLGSEGEAIIDKNGKIKVFVDTRYHLLVDKQVFEDVEVYKMELGETFLDAFKKCYPKNTVLYLPFDIPLRTYFSYDKYFDLRKYDIKKKYLKNIDFNKKSSIFRVSKNIEKISFLEKVAKLKKANPNVNKMLVFNLDEISYLTNLRSYQMAYSSNFRSILYLDFESKKYILFSDKISNKNLIEGLDYLSLDDFSDYIASVEKEVYFNIDEINLNQFLSIKLPKELKKNNLATLASIKSTSIINELEKSFKNLDKAIFNFKNRIKAGLSEYDLTKIFEEELLKAGAKCLSFKTILAIGENSASIHYSQPDKNKILKNESII